MLDRQSSAPLHQQLEDLIKEKIGNEEWRTNTQIPSENELSLTYGVSRMTTRSVVSRLAAQGLVYRVPGKGTFVAQPKIAQMAHLPIGIQRQLDAQGVRSDIRLLGITRQPASSRIRRTLALAPEASVWRIERFRTLNGEPLSIHLSFLPVPLFPDLDARGLDRLQLRTVLEDGYGLRPSRVVESVETALASEREARLLGVDPGFTLLKLEETNFSEADSPYEYCHVLFRGDKMKITFEFHSAYGRDTDPAGFGAIMDAAR